MLNELKFGKKVISAEWLVLRLARRKAYIAEAGVWLGGVTNDCATEAFMHKPWGPPCISSAQAV